MPGEQTQVGIFKVRAYLEHSQILSKSENSKQHEHQVVAAVGGKYNTVKGFKRASTQCSMVMWQWLFWHPVFRLLPQITFYVRHSTSAFIV